MSANKQCPKCKGFKTTDQIILGVSMGALGASCSVCLLFIPIVLLITIPFTIVGIFTAVYNIYLKAIGQEVGYYCMNCKNKWKQ